MNNTINLNELTRADKVKRLQDAADLLAQAELLIRETGDQHLINYVANHIDANGICTGTSMVGEICARLDEHNAEAAEEVKNLMANANNI